MSIRKGPCRSAHSILLGAAGFGIGLAIAGVASGLLGYPLNDSARWHNLSVLIILASSLGGAMLGWAEKSEAVARRLALAGAVGGGFGYFASVVGSFILRMVIENRFVITPILCIVVGTSIGMFLGLAWKSRKHVVMFTLAGVVGSGLFYLVALVVGAFLLLFEGSITLCCEVREGVARGLWWAIGGAVFGACLGVVHSKVHRPEYPV